MTEQKHKIPTERVAWYDPLFDEIVDYLKETEVIEEYEEIMSASVDVTAGEMIEVYDIETEVR